MERLGFNAGKEIINGKEDERKERKRKIRDVGKGCREGKKMKEFNKKSTRKKGGKKEK